MPINLAPDRANYVTRIIRGQSRDPRSVDQIAYDRADHAYRTFIMDHVGSEGAAMILPADEMRVRMDFGIPHLTETPVDRWIDRVRGRDHARGRTTVHHTPALR